MSDEGEQCWLVFNIGGLVHVLPVTLTDGVYTLALGHTFTSECQCRPDREQHPLSGSWLINHIEPSWDGANEYQGVVQ